ncbi:hypothetical protein ACQPXM_11285 [Kribbella sp. CA-253562]|uniref:hypothetical protein n=1 Tax=Kribbella sp. CA-253562 TaxID=3239942 RepID=UPI003D91EE91
MLCPVKPGLTQPADITARDGTQPLRSRGRKQLVDDIAANLNELAIELLGEDLIELGYRLGYYTLAVEDPG